MLFRSADIDAQTAKDIENIAKSPVTTRKDIKRRIESRDRLSNMLNKLNLGDVGKHAGTKLTAEDLASLYSIDDTEARKKKAVELRNKLKKSETRMERWTSVSTPYGTQLVRTDKKVATTDTQQLMYNQVANDIITAVIASMSREGRGSEADKVRTQLIRDRLVQGEQDAANALIKAYREDPSSLPFDVETTEAYKARRTRIQGDALGGRLAGETATDFKAAEKALKEREQKYTTLSGDINKRHRALLDNPDLRKRLTKAEAAKALEPAYRDLDLERKKIEEARKVVLDYGKEAIDASSTYLENVSNKLQFEGKDAESYVYKSAMTEAITSEIARLKDVLSQTTTDAVKNQLRAQIVALQKKRGDLTKVDSKALSGFMSTFVDGLSSASKRREDALSNGVKYRGLNSQEMWHSVNMLSRVAGNGIARRAFVPAYQVRDGIRARDLQAKARAEQQVYAAADSFIMSKKYEEANLGKTVVNIYDFMRNNNTIMVNK